ncbi:MAG: DUF3750 domain-containing protein [Planctomycetota bacterium]
MLKSIRLPARSWIPWYSRFAEHTWIDFRHAGIWHRVEWNNVDYVVLEEIGTERAFANQRWQVDVAVHECLRGPTAAAAAARILSVATSYPCAQHYRAWPGPNSNSFIDWLAREVDLGLVLPPTSVGQDFTTWVHAGVTTSGTGLELETLPLGIELGLREGVELHILGLTLGVGLWPPSLKLPFLPEIPGGWFGP